MRHFCKDRPFSTTNANVERMSINDLKEELQEFFLWGESFGDGRLDKALQQSDDSREIVMELLCDVGYILTCGKLNLCCVFVLSGDGCMSHR